MLSAEIAAEGAPVGGFSFLLPGSDILTGRDIQFSHFMQKAQISRYSESYFVDRRVTKTDYSERMYELVTVSIKWVMRRKAKKKSSYSGWADGS